jgi:hypothetical protein
VPPAAALEVATSRPAKETHQDDLVESTSQPPPVVYKHTQEKSPNLFPALDATADDGFQKVLAQPEPDRSSPSSHPSEDYDFMDEVIVHSGPSSMSTDDDPFVVSSSKGRRSRSFAEAELAVETPFVASEEQTPPPPQDDPPIAVEQHSGFFARTITKRLFKERFMKRSSKTGGYEAFQDK